MVELRLETLNAYVDELRNAVRRDGATVVASFGPPGTADGIAVCNAFFDSRLPADLMRFWAECDEFSVEVFSPELPLSKVPLMEFSVRSPIRMVVRSQILRDQCEAMRQLGEEDYLPKIARCYADLAGFGDADRLTLLDARNSGCSVIDVSTMEEWFDQPNFIVADSVSDLVERCFQFALSTRTGFRYWRDPEQ